MILTLFSYSDGGNTSAAASPTLKDVLIEHIGKNIYVPEEISLRQIIPVRRREVWKDTLRAMKQPTFSFSKGVNINFVSFSNKLEEAVDEGGPTREYFRLLMKALSGNSGLFCGQENRRTAGHNLSALHKGDYQRVGQCIAMSVLYNGPGPHFFSETVANYLLHIPITTVPLEDIPDYEVREKVMQVCVA